MLSALQVCLFCKLFSVDNVCLAEFVSSCKLKGMLAMMRRSLPVWSLHPAQACGRQHAALCHKAPYEPNRMSFLHVVDKASWFAGAQLQQPAKDLQHELSRSADSLQAEQARLAQ